MVTRNLNSNQVNWSWLSVTDVSWYVNMVAAAAKIQVVLVVINCTLLIYSTILHIITRHLHKINVKRAGSQLGSPILWAFLVSSTASTTIEEFGVFDGSIFFPSCITVEREKSTWVGVSISVELKTLDRPWKMALKKISLPQSHSSSICNCMQHWGMMSVG